MTAPKENPEEKPGTRQTRALAVLVIGGSWLIPGLLFRTEKALMLPGGPTAVELLAMPLPEMGVWLIAAALFMATAAIPGRRFGLLWWPVFVGGVVFYHLLSVMEHCYVEYTGMRMHGRTVKYGVLRFEELRLIVQRVVGEEFFLRISIATAVFLLSWALFWILRHRASGPGLRSAWLCLGLGILALAVPMPERLRETGLGGAMLVELLRPMPDLEQLYEKIPREVQAAAPAYRVPKLVEGGPGVPLQRPNVVLVILESTGAAMVPPYSDPRVWNELPAMAALARESVVFDPVYTSISHTSKALVGILCGVFPRPILDIRESVKGWPWPVRCLPSLLEEAGYRTAFLQSAEEVFENRMVLVRRMGFGTAAFQETMLREPFQKLGYFSMEDRAMVEPAVGWAQSAGTPFFLTLLTSAVHHPYDVPGLPPNDDPARYPAYYRAALKEQDAFLGELLKAMEDAGLLDNTLVVVLGDHGEAFGEHVGMQHNWVPYEEVVRVPLMIKGPGVGPPRRVERLSHQVDLLPTLLDLLAVPWEGELPGVDLFGETPREFAWSSCWGSRTCMSARRGDLKLVYHFEVRPTQLFDLSVDPLERNNLASSLPEEKLRLERELIARLAAVDRFWERHDASLAAGER